MFLHWWNTGSVLLTCSQDLATQLYHSSLYTKACRKVQIQKGKYLSIPMAEHLSGHQCCSHALTLTPLLQGSRSNRLEVSSGLPRGWTSSFTTLTHQDVLRACPWKGAPVMYLVACETMNFEGNLVFIRLRSTSVFQCFLALVALTWACLRRDLRG